MKKLISLLLTLSMLLALLTACTTSSVPGTETEEPSIVKEEAIVSDNTDAEVEMPVASAEDVVDTNLADTDQLEAVNKTVDLPLVAEPVTIRFWNGGWNGSEYGLTDPNEILSIQEYEKRTGIKVEYITTSFEANEEQTSLMFASGDYPDVLPTGYAGGLEKGVEDEVYLLLNDIIDENMPNYSSLRMSDTTVYKDTITDESNLIAIYQLNKTVQPPWYGLLCREDYLEAVGMDVPVTYDDMHDVLTAFKTELGLTHAYQLSSLGYSILGNCMMAGYNTSQTWYQIDGEAIYGPVTENFKKYLQTMNQWYEEGLISQDFMTASPFDSAHIMNGDAGVFTGDYLACTGYPNSMAEGARVIGIPEPVENWGDEIHIGQFNTRTGATGVCIAATTEYPELILRWLDYGYSEEGSLLGNYGLEGVTFNYDNDGNVTFTDLILDNPDGLTFNQALAVYMHPGTGPRLNDWEREMKGINEDSVNAMQTWVHDGAYVYPDKVTMSAEEGAELNNVMSDIETYVSTMILKFITGQESFDQWDSYVQYIEGSGLDQAVAIKQAVLDRYNNR